MDFPQCFHQRHHHPKNFFRIYLSVFFHILLKRFPLYIFHHDICGAVFLKIVNNFGNIIQIHQIAQDVGFIQDFISCFLILHGKFFHRNGNSHALVLSPISDSKAAFSQYFLNNITPVKYRPQLQMPFPLCFHTLLHP